MRRRLKTTRWPEDQVEFVLANLTRMTIPEIAAALGRSPSAVKTWCWRHGHSSRNQDLLTSGDAARLFGVSCQWLTELARTKRLRKARREPGGRWWLFDPDELRRYFQKRKEALNVSRPEASEILPKAS